MNGVSIKRSYIILGIFILMLFTFCCLQESEVYAEEPAASGAVTESSAEASTESVVPPIDISMELGATLYKGDKVTLELKGMPQTDQITAESSNTRVATVNKSGVIKALKCGKTRITITGSDGSTVKTVIIKLKVVKCSYRTRKNLLMYRGEKESISASSNYAGAVCRLNSSDRKVAASAGNALKALKKGKTWLTASSEAAGRKAEISLKLRVAEKPVMKVTNAMEDKWFRGSVMAGHSVGVGFQMYCRTRYNGFLGNARHISVGCYGVYNDMRPVGPGSLHPTVNGRKARLKDHITALGTRKVFINYGLNDIGVFGPDKFVTNYEKLIKELIKQNKKTTVYIVSPTPMYKPSGALNNGNMKKINKALKSFAKKTDRVEFIDVFTPMLDSSGKLKGEYCSDAYCHITNAGYKVYSDTLKEYARKKIIEETDKKDKLITVRESKKTNGD